MEKPDSSLTVEYRKVHRAKIILMSAGEMKNSDIVAGIDYAINDSACSSKPNAITERKKHE